MENRHLCERKFQENITLILKTFFIQVWVCKTLSQRDEHLHTWAFVKKKKEGKFVISQAAYISIYQYKMSYPEDIWFSFILHRSGSSLGTVLKACITRLKSLIFIKKIINDISCFFHNLLHFSVEEIQENSRCQIMSLNMDKQLTTF